MKILFNKLLSLLLQISTDKYQHFAIGTVISSIVLIICSILLPNALAYILSFSITLAAAYIKEKVIDNKIDYKDIIATVLGGLVVILSAIIV
jgi:hypothetical protein